MTNPAEEACSPAASLRLAISHIEHMSKWITAQNAGYSFESLGEDMDAIRAGLASFESQPAPLPQVVHVLETVGVYLQDNILEHAVVNLRTNETLGALVATTVAQLKGAGIAPATTADVVAAIKDNVHATIDETVDGVEEAAADVIALFAKHTPTSISDVAAKYPNLRVEKPWPLTSPVLLQLAEDACASAIKLIGAICEDHEFEPIALRLNDQIYAFRTAARDKRDAAPKRWRHVERGTTYTEIERGKLQKTPSSFLYDMDEVVVYRADADGSLWVRSAREFDDGRFVPVAS